MKPAELASESNGEYLRDIAPRFFWAEHGQDQLPHSPLPEWFRTTEFRASRLATAFPGFAALVDQKGPLTDFVFDLITPRSLETGSHPAQALTEAEIILTTAHGWAARKEVMGVLPHLIVLFSKHRVVGINPTLPGFGPSGFKESVPNAWRTPKGIDAVLLQAFSAMGIEEPPPGKVAVHCAHSMGPITFLNVNDRYHRLRDPRYGHVLFNPAFAEVDWLYRLVSYKSLGQASRLLAIPGVKKAFAALAAETVTQLWGGPHTTETIKDSHGKTVMETSPRTIAYSLLALADERPLEAARLNGKLGGTNAQVFLAEGDRFTPLKKAYDGLVSAGLEPKKIVQLPGAGHYSFGLEGLFPPKEIPHTKEALQAWVLEEARENPDVARVVGIAQQTASFIDAVFERQAEL